MKPELPLPMPEQRADDDPFAGGSVTGAFASPRPPAVASPAVEQLAPPALNQPAVPAEPPPVTIPAMVPKAPPPASAGFTQMMRALNMDQVAAPVPPFVPAAPTPMPRPLPVASSPVASAATLPSSQAPAYEGAPSLTPPAPDSPAGAHQQPVGTFTELFQALPLPAPEAGTLTQASAPGSTTEPLPTIQPPHAPPSQSNSAPGSFSQLFQPASFAASASPVHPPAPMVAAPVPTSTVASPAGTAPAFTIAPASPSPGAFTQMFQALNPVAATPTLPPVLQQPQLSTSIGTVPPSSPHAVPISPAASARPASSPDDFDDLFAQLSHPASAVPSPAAANTPPLLSAPADSPGSFTQMFQTLAPPANTAGGGAPFVPSSSFPPASPSASPSTASPNLPAYLGPDSRAAKPFSLETSRNAPFAAPGAPMQPPAGPGLTQMLNSLAQPQTPSRSAPTPMAPPPPERSIFTASYEALSASVAPTPPPLPRSTMPPPSAVFSQLSAPSSSAGPSEFTRILNASALRETALRGSAPPIGSTTEATAAAPARVASLPAATPAQAASEQPATGMHKYLPLLLVLVIFLLIAILIAVVVLMKH